MRFRPPKKKLETFDLALLLAFAFFVFFGLRNAYSLPILTHYYYYSKTHRFLSKMALKPMICLSKRFRTGSRKRDFVHCDWI